MEFIKKKIIYTLKNYGWFGLCKECYFSLIAFPFVLIILALDPWIKIRLIKLYSWRAGHYGLNTHLMLCFLQQNEDKHRYKRFYYADPYEICNTQLHKMWKRVLFIIPFRRICFQIDRLLTVIRKEKYTNDPIKQFEISSGAEDIWGFFHTLREQEPYLKFTRKEIKKGVSLLQKLGIPQGSTFVCLLVRDSKYLQVHMNNDGSYDRYRDADILNYHKAITLLINKGYYVIRMGKAVSNTLGFNHDLVIDYANHPLRSDFLDIFLSATCYFFISSSTGLDSIPRILGKPLLLTNYPLYDLNFTNYDMFIPKLVKDPKNDRLLAFNEIFSLFESYKKYGGRGRMMTDNQSTFVENSSDDIADAVNDMMDYLSNKTTDEEKALQKKFWENYPIPWPIPYHELTKLHVSPRFLKKYSFLLQ